MELLLILAWLLLCWYLVTTTRYRARNLPPGPLALPLVGCIFSLRQPLHRHFAKISRNYGPVMHLKLGMLHVVVANTSEAAKEVLHTNDLEFANRPATKLFEHFSLGYKDMICVPYGEHWKAMRRIAHVNMFSAAKLDQTAGLREAEIKGTVRAILELPRHALDLRTMLAEFFGRVVCLSLFGKNSRAKQVVNAVNKLSATIVNMNIGDLFPALDGLDLHGLYKRLRKEFVPQLTSLLSEIMEEERTLNDPDATHVLRNLLNSQEIEDSLSDTCIMALLIDMISGGIDTSQSTAEWAMAELISKPGIMKRAQQEIDEKVGTGMLVKDSDLPDMRYLEAIVKETLRLHPVFPLCVPHTNSRESTILGYSIPAKTQVMINIWAIGRDPRHWEHPDEFSPERFLGSSTSLTSRNFELIPFSAGRRVCPGYQLALRSVSLAVATLVQAFHWESRGAVDLKEDEGLLACKLASSLFAYAKPRLVNSVYA